MEKEHENDLDYIVDLEEDIDTLNIINTTLKAETKQLTTQRDDLLAAARFAGNVIMSGAFSERATAKASLEQAIAKAEKK